MTTETEFKCLNSELYSAVTGADNAHNNYGWELLCPVNNVLARFNELLLDWSCVCSTIIVSINLIHSSLFVLPDSVPVYWLLYISRTGLLLSVKLNILMLYVLLVTCNDVESLQENLQE